MDWWFLVDGSPWCWLEKPQDFSIAKILRMEFLNSAALAARSSRSVGRDASSFWLQAAQCPSDTAPSNVSVTVLFSTTHAPFHIHQPHPACWANRLLCPFHKASWNPRQGSL